MRDFLGLLGVVIPLIVRKIVLFGGSLGSSLLTVVNTSWFYSW